MKQQKKEYMILKKPKNIKYENLVNDENDKKIKMII